MITLDRLRYAVRARMGRECAVPLDECSVCRRNLEEMEAVLAAINCAVTSPWARGKITKKGVEYPGNKTEKRFFSLVKVPKDAEDEFL